MKSLTTGLRPDITPAQVIAGIPVIANLLAAFHVYTVSAAQQDALSQTILWAGVLVGADAALRIGRNLAQAKTDAAMYNAVPPTDPGGVVHDPETDDVPIGDLPTDAEERKAPPPSK